MKGTNLNKVNRFDYKHTIIKLSICVTVRSSNHIVNITKTWFAFQETL